VSRDPATVLAETEKNTSRVQAIAEVAAYLVASGVAPDEAQDDSRALLRAAAGLTRLQLAMSPQAPLSDEEADRLSRYAARRAAREPVSRILGERGFWTLDLIVTPNVLDPRSDTEALVETTLALIDKHDAPLEILDLGCGSGAIICALLSELPRARGVAVDLSPDACATASENLTRCGFGARARVIRGNWGEALSGSYDVIVSNPPYIREGELSALDPEVRLYDPSMALDGGPDGLDCYRAIVSDLARLLKPDGLVAFEVGHDQAVRVAALLGDKGFGVVRVGRDAGGHERVVAARPAPGRP
jgi:release factor glutamine methyltransferase